MPLGDLPLVHYAFTFTVVLLGIKWYSKRGPNLESIPTVGFSGPILSYITAVQFIFYGDKLIQEGYDKYKGGLFKIAMLDHWEVIASGHQATEDVRKAPDDVLSMVDATVRQLQADYTLGPESTRNQYHVNVIRNQLTRGLKVYFPELREEIVTSFDDFIPAKDDWVSYPAHGTLMQIVCRTINRTFVGLPKCRDADYCELNINFTTDVIKSAFIINLFPDVFKPLVGPLFSCITSSVGRAIHHLAPIIEDRRQKLRDRGDDWNDKPNDMLMWLIEEAQGDERSVRNLALRILVVNFAAIHTSSMSFTQVLYNLAANPQYAPALREEIESVIAADGWTKLAMNKMRKVDSFLRECQRHDVLGSLIMQRVAVKPFAFSNGLTIPAGTNLSCTLAPTHRDAENYTNADVFDPWRFAAMREGEGEGSKYQLVSTSPEYLAFGHGRHACPGRFFVANELKAMLAHVVVTYDVKFEDGLVAPPKLCIGSLLAPGKAKVMFRKRQV